MFGRGVDPIRPTTPQKLWVPGELQVSHITKREGTLTKGPGGRGGGHTQHRCAPYRIKSGPEKQSIKASDTRPAVPPERPPGPRSTRRKPFWISLRPGPSPAATS